MIAAKLVARVWVKLSRVNSSSTIPTFLNFTQDSMKYNNMIEKIPSGLVKIDNYDFQYEKPTPTKAAKEKSYATLLERVKKLEEMEGKPEVRVTYKVGAFEVSDWNNNYLNHFKWER